MLELLLKLWPESLLTQTLSVGVVVGVSAYLFFSKRYNLPPGPTAWPTVGNIFSLMDGLIFVKLHEWSKQYGPVMTIHLGMSRTVVLSNIDMVTEALIKRGADFAGRPQTFAGKMFSDGGKDIVFANYSPTWKLHRKLASKAIRQYLKGDSLEKKITNSLRITTELMKNEPGPFDPYQYMSLVVFNILSGICFDKTSANTKDERFELFVGNLDKAQDQLESGVIIEDVFPPWRLLPNTSFRKVYGFNRILIGGITKEVEEHRQSFSPDHVRDFTDAILLAQKEAEVEEDPALLAQITDIHVTHTVTDVFFAGTDTSRQTLRWSLLVMATYPDVQKKVQDEVDQVIGSDLAIKLSMRSDLPYTEAVLHEVMRLKPVAPIGIPHMTLCNTTVGGFDVPKGTQVFINHYALHFDTNQWGDVNTFRPERFLDTSGKMAPKPDSWLPFSAGRRVCLGETLAKPELHLILAGILRAFDISLAPGDKSTLETATKGQLNHPARYKIIVKPRV